MDVRNKNSTITAREYLTTTAPSATGRKKKKNNSTKSNSTRTIVQQQHENNSTTKAQRHWTTLAPKREWTRFEASPDPLPESHTMTMLSKLNLFFSGYYDPININLYSKKVNFRGDLTDMSRRTKTLVTQRVHFHFDHGFLRCKDTVISGME